MYTEDKRKLGFRPRHWQFLGHLVPNSAYRCHGLILATSRQSSRIDQSILQTPANAICRIWINHHRDFDMSTSLTLAGRFTLMLS
jgi:hypothetical protein